MLKPLQFSLSSIIVVLLLWSMDAAGLRAAQRTWIGGNATWFDNGAPSLWNPADEPDFDDEAIFNTPNVVPLGSANLIMALTMSNGIALNMNGFQLQVTGQTNLSGLGTTLIISPHGTSATAAFIGDTLNINSLAQLSMAGGRIDIHDLLSINSGSISGRGTVVVGDSNPQRSLALRNSSSIIVTSAGTPATLTLQAVGNDTLDLDGSSETGLLLVTNTSANVNEDTLTLVIDGALADDFSGQLLIGQRDTATFQQNFAMNGANVQIDGGGFVAQMNGTGAGTSISNSTWSVTGKAVIENELHYTQFGNSINVNPNSIVEFAGLTEILDAFTLNLSANTSQLIVSGDMTILDGADNFNWDGPGAATTTIRGDGDLNISALHINSNNDTYSGTINLNDDGDLNVFNGPGAWSMNGVLNKNQTGSSTIGGARILINGDVNANAGTLQLPAVTLNSNADITVLGTLEIGGNSILAGPSSVVGTGRLRIMGTSSVTANTTINVADFDWDGVSIGTQHTIEGVTFTINTQTFDGDGDMDDPILLMPGSRLTVNGPAEWTMASQLDAGVVSGGTNVVTIDGTSRFVLSGPSAQMNVHATTDLVAPYAGNDSGAGKFVLMRTGPRRWNVCNKPASPRRMESQRVASRPPQDNLCR